MDQFASCVFVRRPTSRHRSPWTSAAHRGLGAVAVSALLGFQPNAAHAAVVGACSGVSLPPSVVTGFLAPVFGLLAPGLNIGPVNLGNTVTSINNGAPIALQVLDTNGNVVSNTAPCVTTSDGVQLNTPKGIAFGGNQITGLGNGTAASASEINSIAIGNDAQTAPLSAGAVAIGAGTRVGASGAMALGTGASATSDNSVALGANSVAGAANGGWAGTTIGGTVIMSNVLNANAVVGVSGGGVNRQITGVADGAVNASSTDAVNGSQLYYSIQALNNAIASTPTGGLIAADNAYGQPLPTVAAGQNGVAIGYGATGTGANSVAIGNGATDGGRANVLSVGAVGATRQVINVTAGTQGTDAVNVAQLQPLVTALGGGATFNATTGAVTGPSYNVGGNTYNDVGSALAATNRLAVQYTPDANGNPTNRIVLSGANNGQPVSISNVAAGINGTDAVNVNQLKGVSSRVDQLASSISSLSGDIAQNQTEARRGIATTAAMANLPFGTTPGKWSPAVSFGGFKDQTAVAMGIQYNAAGDYRLKLRATASIVPRSNDVTFGGGAGMEF